jgi:hypothetical protein
MMPPIITMAATTVYGSKADEERNITVGPSALPIILVSIILTPYYRFVTL